MIDASVARGKHAFDLNSCIKHRNTPIEIAHGATEVSNGSWVYGSLSKFTDQRREALNRECAGKRKKTRREVFLSQSARGRTSVSFPFATAMVCCKPMMQNVPRTPRDGDNLCY